MNNLNVAVSEIKDVPIRHMKFNINPSKLNKYCCANDAVASAVVYAFLGTIPFGERMVINSAREWRDEIKDPELKAQITGLIGQEAIHSKVHEDYNRAYQEIGIPLDKVEALGKLFIDKFIMKVLGKRARLAACAGFEHYTASMAEIYLQDPSLWLDQFDPPVRDMLVWHLMEELEHKSVAFDLYQDVSGKYSIRVLSGAFNYVWVTTMLTMATFTVLRTPGYKSQKRNSAKQDGNKKLPMLTPSKRALKLLSDYFKPSFHPDQTESDDLLNEWRERLFGSAGEFKEYLAKVVVPR